MHKYQPRIHIIRTSDPSQIPWAAQQAFVFPETEFVAVTAYQVSYGGGKGKVSKVNSADPGRTGTPLSGCSGENATMSDSFHRSAYAFWGGRVTAADIQF